MQAVQQQAAQQAAKMHAAAQAAQQSPQVSQPAFEVSPEQAVQFRNEEAVRLQNLRHQWLLRVSQFLNS